MGRRPRKRDAVDFFRDEVVSVPNSRGFQIDHGFPKGAAAPKGMQRLVAALQPPRLPVGDNLPIKYQRLKFVSCASIRPSFPQKARPTFKIFTKTNRIYPSSALWDECLGKRGACRFFSNQSAVLPNTTDEPSHHHQPIRSVFILGRHLVSTRPKNLDSL